MGLPQTQRMGWSDLGTAVGHFSRMAEREAIQATHEGAGAVAQLVGPFPSTHATLGSILSFM